jgi:tRNA-dihydrouridine synthase A
MIGRAAFHNPWILVDADETIFGALPHRISREEVIAQYLAFAEPWYVQGVSWSRVVRPLIGLFHGQPGGRIWRQRLSTGGRGAADLSAIRDAVANFPGVPGERRQQAA